MSAEQLTVATGSCTSISGIVVGFTATAIPLLQVVSLLVGITVGILTAIYTWKRIRAKKFG